jgi:NitT/TauT family transport system substrate-binding protein
MQTSEVKATRPFADTGMILRLLVTVALSFTFAVDTRADAIMVANYGVAAAGMPYAVALELGYFKEFGVNIDKVIDAEGEPAIRALVLGKAIYAEISPIAVLNSARSGSSALRIVSCNVQTGRDYAWASVRATGIASAEDMRGLRLGYTNSGSSTEVLVRAASASAYAPGSAPSYTRVGSLAAGLTFLKLGGVDAMPIPRSMWRAALADSVKLTPISDSTLHGFVDAVGVATDDVAVTHHDLLSGVLRARRKAIDYMRANPEAAALIIGKAFKMEPSDVKPILDELQKASSPNESPFWTTGDVSAHCVNGIRESWAQSRPEGDPADLQKAIDATLLPVDLSNSKSS